MVRQAVEEIFGATVATLTDDLPATSPSQQRQPLPE